jgi:hypothetical protein
MLYTRKEFSIMGESGKVNNQNLYTLHHIAATGGSIISQAIAKAANCLLLSEINPHATVLTNNLGFNRTSIVEHVCKASQRDLSRPLKFEYFSSLLSIAIKHSQECSKNLLIRDHSHSSFDWIANTKQSNFLIYLNDWLDLHPDFNIKSLLSVRHPIDSFISNQSYGWHTRLSRKGDFDEYCKNLLIFDRYFVPICVDVIRYEDFCIGWEDVVSGILDSLNIHMLEFASYELLDIPVTGKSGRKTSTIEPRKRKIEKLSNELIHAAKNSESYHEYCVLHSYNEDPYADPCLEERDNA